MLGPLQFSSTVRTRHRHWHRRSGRVYLICALVIGVSALLMIVAMPSIGGATQAAATTLVARVFVFARSKASWHRVRRAIRRHREWMIRAFAIGLAVATSRPMIGRCFATGRLTGRTPAAFFGMAFWMGVVLHLRAAEVWIQWTRSPPEQTLVVGK